MTDRFKNQGAGKGDKSRISDYKKYSENAEKLFCKKGWKYWCLWEGYDPDRSQFDESGLMLDEQISFKEYRSRIIKLKKL